MKKKMNVVKWSCIIGGCVCLGGCQPKCEDDPNLTADELSWINCFRNGQMLIFKSDTGSYDTAIIYKKVEITGTLADSKGCPHSCQAGSVFLDGLKLNHGFGIFVSHYNQWYPNNQNSAKISYDIINSGIRFSNNTPQNNVAINGNTYNNVYILSGLPGPAFIDYTKLNGVLSFDDYNGHRWVKIN